MTEMKEALRECPFCGHAGRITHHGKGAKSTYIEVVCDECGCTGPAEETYTAAIAAWNRRAALASAPAGEGKDGWKLVPVEPTDEMVDAALKATSVHLNIPGSQLTVNREKMRIRYRAMLRAARKDQP